MKTIAVKSLRKESKKKYIYIATQWPYRIVVTYPKICVDKSVPT